MFQKLFQQVSEFQIEGQPNLVRFSISANEKSIVLWLQLNENRFLTLDRLDGTWKSREQQFSISGIGQPFKLYLNEKGNILIMYDTAKRYIYTWLRLHMNQNWLLRSTLDLQTQINTTSDVNCFLRIKFLQITNIPFTSSRDWIFKYNDFMNCLTYGYEKDVLAEVTDSTVYFWREDPKTWIKEKPAFYDCEIIPHYSCFQRNEVKAFVNGAVWMITYPEREFIAYEDERITKCVTQSALNYFFQLEEPTKNSEQYIHFWHRENQSQKNFNYEKLNFTAVNILLGQNGNVFVAMIKSEQFLKIQIYEGLQTREQLQQII